MIVYLPRSGSAMKIIKSITGRFASKAQAMQVLERELQEFAYDGLVALREDLEADRVGRGTWDNCVLSYRRGYAGSANRDSKGNPGNHFTRYWDSERITPQEVIAAVDAEIDRRFQEAQRAHLELVSGQQSDALALV